MNVKDAQNVMKIVIAVVKVILHMLPSVNGSGRTGNKTLLIKTITGFVAIKLAGYILD